MGKINYKNKIIFLKEKSLDQLMAIDPDIPNNKDLNTGKPNKPLFIAVSDTGNKDIYWAIPITSKVDKYKELQHNSNFKEKFQFYYFNGKECCFNISGMFPIHSDDINNIYKKKGIPVKLKYTERKTIIQTANKILLNQHLKKSQLVLKIDSLYEQAKKRNKQNILTINRPTSGKERTL